MKKLNPGDRIPHGDYNKLVDDYLINSPLQKDILATGVAPVYGVATTSVPAYSLIGITGEDSTASAEIPVVTVDAPGDSPAGLFTNGPYAGTKIPLFPLTYGAPIKLAVESTFAGNAGDTVGPVSGEHTVSETGTGLVCLSQKRTAPDGTYFIWAMLAISKGGGGDALIAVTPSGGIAAMTDTTPPFAFTHATCYRVNPDSGEYIDPVEEVEIYNMVDVAIAGSVLIQAKKIGSRWFVDVDNCSGSSVDLPELAEPPPPP